MVVQFWSRDLRIANIVVQSALLYSPSSTRRAPRTVTHHLAQADVMPMASGRRQEESHVLATSQPISQEALNCLLLGCKHFVSNNKGQSRVEVVLLHNICTPPPLRGDSLGGGRHLTSILVPNTLSYWGIYRVRLLEVSTSNLAALQYSWLAQPDLGTCRTDRSCSQLFMIALVSLTTYCQRTKTVR